ncbi:hypothetical protein BUALT_Bualt11G0009700 [Buddleja alternifolia]|uniref:Shikimate kinase n=1 Tax=Buddleja alternifolia TaxID=168488 RepID=A0AAV6WQL2_9LAMI|nr:hypothetical protein BUALT_Bualt11G0009700 [Buddleja alternifolia]
MEATVSQGLQLSTWINPEKIAMKQGNSLQFFQKYGAQRRCQTPISCRLSSRKGRSHRRTVPMVSCSSENIPASVLESESFPVLSDEFDLKNKSKEIEPYLNGRCIYLVGMMGSGKTTVGKVLSEALGYSFYDCDTLIEEAVGGNSVAEIFKLHGETFFRDSEVSDLSSFLHVLL